jgi:hypothetical protein
VVGYRVYNPSGTKICDTTVGSSYPATCPGNSNAWCFSATDCTDLTPPAFGSNQRTYKIVALYYDANNVLQEGTARNVTLDKGTPSPPPQVPSVSLTAVTQPDNTAIITWTPPTGGTTVSFYRIYRDGSDYTSRYDTVPASSCSATCTYHDTNRLSPHDYYISAVGGTTPGSNMAESAQTGPVNG